MNKKYIVLVPWNSNTAKFYVHTEYDNYREALEDALDYGDGTRVIRYEEGLVEVLWEKRNIG